MRSVRTVIAGATAAAATLGVLGLTAPALAQSHVAAIKTANVPAGIATGINMTSCPSGQTASFGSSAPALPATEFPVASKNIVKLIGVWPTTPTSYTVTVNCSGGTSINTKVAVAAAPPLGSAVGVGSDTITPITDQFSSDFNASSRSTKLYSFDAINPTTGGIGDTITPKVGCNTITRPNGSSAGIQALSGSQVLSGTNCIDFARSSRPRGSSDPAFAPGGVAFVALAGDLVDWSAQATTNAPKSLTPTQLNEIYSCTVPAANGFNANTWGALGGKGNNTIQPFLPQSGSGTLSFFEAAIGITTPGPCVSNVNNTLEENEGVNAALQSPNAIFPYSVGDWIAQKFHSAKCTNANCAPNLPAPLCTPAAGKNQFGCAVNGTMVPGQINGVAPTTGSGTGTAINLAFDATFDRILYDVVPFDPNTADHIPGATSPVGGVNLEPVYGASGWACTSSAAATDIKNYGFVKIGSCGSTS